eukprot:gene953-biopygen9380
MDRMDRMDGLNESDGSNEQARLACSSSSSFIRETDSIAGTPVVAVINEPRETYKKGDGDSGMLAEFGPPCPCHIDLGVGQKGYNSGAEVVGESCVFDDHRDMIQTANEMNNRG